MNTSGILNNNKLFSRLPAFRMRKGLVFGLIIFIALISFEAFNYSTTEVALKDMLGDLRFAGIQWATILSLAFCGIDFAGIARLFSPESDSSEDKAAWYLFGAWILAATMNAMLTWWGVSMAVLSRSVQTSTVVDQATLMKVVPVFVAVMVWLIRILIIGSLSYAGGRAFNPETAVTSTAPHTRTNARSASAGAQPSVKPMISASAETPAATTSAYPVRPAPKPALRPETARNRPEPTYQTISMHGNNETSKPATRR